jgi:hypothetical protein
VTVAPSRDLSQASSPRWLGRAYVSLFAVALVGLACGAFLVAVTVPYHEWDAFAFGEVSRAIGQGRFAIEDFGAAFLHRPLFFVLQGWLWQVIGFSFVSGRLLGLVFAALLVVSTARLARDPSSRARAIGLSGALAGLLLLSVPALSVHVVSGLSDVPAAAMVALTAAVALTAPKGRIRWSALVVLGALTVLTKPSTLAPLAGLMIATLLVENDSETAWSADGIQARARASLAPLAAGTGMGLVVDLLLARRIGSGLFDFLTAGSGGYWGERADAERWDALLRLDVLGPCLRLPLAFVLVYAAARVARAAHRPAAVGALVAAVGWTVGGSLVAAPGEGELWSAEATFCWIGFLGMLTLFCLAPAAHAPSRSRIARLLLLGLPPLVVWVYATPYDERLAATAWPGLCAMLGLVVAVPIVGLARSAGVAALAPALVLVVAFWSSLASLDGFGDDHWRELRSLGRDGVWDADRTLNLVLPAVQSSMAAIDETMGDEGRLLTTDPRFGWWFPGRVSTELVVRCDQLAGYSAFILLTSDESVAQIESEGGSGDPAWWARCEQPRLVQLTDGENGMAAFAVEP